MSPSMIATAVVFRRNALLRPQLHVFCPVFASAFPADGMFQERLRSAEGSPSFPQCSKREAVPGDRNLGSAPVGRRNLRAIGAAGWNQGCAGARPWTTRGYRVL